MKRLTGLILLAGVFLGLGGCIYDPGYYRHSGVVYDDGYAPRAEPYYSPGYYYDPWYYGWGLPFIGFSYYGSYGGHHHHHGGTHGSTHSGGHHHPH